jgi:hypothetical protein
MFGNQMVHEYVEAPEVLADAINLGRRREADLAFKYYDKLYQPGCGL